MKKSILTLAAGALFGAALTGCEAMPRDQYIQWVARDAWSAQCAEKAIVEIWKVENRRWKVKGEALLVDIDATFKLTDDCAGMKAYESKRFAMKGFEISKCQVGKASGWSLPGKERERCWTGPRLLPEQAPPSAAATKPPASSGAASGAAQPAEAPADDEAEAAAPEAAAPEAAPEADKPAE